jgi:hypothetical protein
VLTYVESLGEVELVIGAMPVADKWPFGLAELDEHPGLLANSKSWYSGDMGEL